VRWNLAVAGLAASWGLIAVLVAAVDLEATPLVVYRLSLAALTVGAFAAVWGRVSLLRFPGAGVVALGVVLALHWELYFLTIKLSSVAVAVLTVYTAPLFISLAAPVLLGERRSRVALVALLPAGAGIVLIALAGEGGGRVGGLALLTGLAAGVTYAALVILTKRLVADVHPVSIAFWSYSAATLALAPLLVTADRVLPESVGELGAVLVLGVVFTGVSGILYITLIGKVTAQAVGVLAFLEPVSAALLAWALVDESLGPAVLVGGGLVLAAGVLVVLREPPDAGPIDAPPVPEPAAARR
jgi:drug/metabolite transporter (DMT)-like permease